ncbi:MAG: hypothetical protein AB1640_25200 [bacterium]
MSGNSRELGATADSPGLHEVNTGPLRYLLSIPSSAPAAADLFPVLVFLHGYDEAAPRSLRQALTLHGPLRPGSAPQAVGRFLVVAPQLPARIGDVWHRFADAVMRIAAEEQQTHRGDPQRTYLTGFSFGANGVFDLALAQTDFWAALWPVDPTRVPRTDPRRPVWLSLGQVSRPLTAKLIAALRLKPAGTVEAEAGDRLYLDAGQDHVGSAAFAYRDDRIYDWILSKRLASPP